MMGHKMFYGEIRLIILKLCLLPLSNMEHWHVDVLYPCDGPIRIPLTYVFLLYFQVTASARAQMVGAA